MIYNFRNKLYQNIFTRVLIVLEIARINKTISLENYFHK